MVGVPQGHQADAVGFGQLDGLLHGEPGVGDAKAQMAVHLLHGPHAHRHLRFRPGPYNPLVNIADQPGEPVDAVGVYALQRVSRHLMGYFFRLFLRAAPPRQHLAEAGLHFLKG